MWPLASIWQEHEGPSLIELLPPSLSFAQVVQVDSAWLALECFWKQIRHVWVFCRGWPCGSIASSVCIGWQGVGVGMCTVSSGDRRQQGSRCGGCFWLGLAASLSTAKILGLSRAPCRCTFNMGGRQCEWGLRHKLGCMRRVHCGWSQSCVSRECHHSICMLTPLVWILYHFLCLWNTIGRLLELMIEAIMSETWASSAVVWSAWIERIRFSCMLNLAATTLRCGSWLGPVTGNSRVIQQVPAPTPTWAHTRAHGYGFGPRVSHESMRQGGDNPPCCVDSHFWMWQGGRTSLSCRTVFVNTAGRGQPFPSHWFVFVGMAGREKPFLSYWFVFFDAAGRKKPSVMLICVCVW